MASVYFRMVGMWQMDTFVSLMTIVSNRTKRKGNQRTENKERCKWKIKSYSKKEIKIEVDNESFTMIRHRWL